LRLYRGTLATRIRDSLFSVFGDDLPKINTSNTPSQIAAWKKSAQVANCYKQIFNNGTVFTSFMEKVFGEDAPQAVHTAYALAICTMLLDPSYDGIQLNEVDTKKMVHHYSVSFTIKIAFVTYFIIYQYFFLGFNQ
jgi:hypothetical protein